MIILASIIIIINLLLGYLVFVQRPGEKRNQYFGLMVFIMCIWSVAILFEGEPLPENISNLFLHLDFASAILFSFLFLKFVSTLSADKYDVHKTYSIHCYLTIILAVLSFTPLLIRDAAFQAGEVSIRLGVFFYPYAAVLLYQLTLGIWNLVQCWRTSSGIQRRQIGMILMGLSLTIVCAVIFVFLLPRIMEIQEGMVRLGMYSTVFFVAGSAYAIARYRFLDTRIFLRKSITASITFLIVVLALTIFAFIAVQYVPNSIYIAPFFAVVLLLVPFAKEKIDHFFQKIIPNEIIDIATLFEKIQYRIDITPVTDFIEKLQNIMKKDYGMIVDVYMQFEKSEFHKVKDAKKIKVRWLQNEILPKENTLLRTQEIADENMQKILKNEKIAAIARLINRYDSTVGVLCIKEYGSAKKFLNENKDEVQYIVDKTGQVIGDILDYEKAKVGVRVTAQRIGQQQL